MIARKQYFFDFLPPAVFVLGLIFSVGAYKTSLSNYEEKKALYLDKLIEQTQTYLSGRFDLYTQALLGGRGLFYSSKIVERAEWHEYVSSMHIEETLPGMLGMGYIARVKQNDLKTFLEKVRRDGAAGFINHPETRLPEKDIITYVEPAVRNKEALGLDIAFEQNRLEAAKNSAASGRPMLTRRVFLVQDKNKQPGFLLFLPMYKNGETPARMEQRMQALVGWVYAPFLGQQFLKDINLINQNQLAFSLYDGDVRSHDTLIYSTLNKDDSKDVDKISSIWLAGRLWTIEWHTTERFATSTDAFVPQFVFYSGMLLTVLVSSFFHLLSRFYGSAARLAKETQERTLLAVEGANLGTWDWDIVTGDTVYDRRWMQMLGYEPNELVSHVSTWQQLLHPDDVANIQPILQEHLDGKTSFYVAEFRMRHKDGHYVWILARGRVLERDASGGALRISGTHLDITDKKQQQEAQEEYARMLEAAKLAAEKAAASKSLFLASMSHEIRTPLNGVIGMVDVLSATMLDEQQKRYVKVIKGSGRILLEIINDVLDFSKIEAGQLKLINRSFSLRSAVEELLTLFSPMADEKGLYLKLDIDPIIPDALIGDSGRLCQIISNLINNAIKFTEKGGVTLVVNNGGAYDDNVASIGFYVHDTGIGIPSDKIPQLFSAFVQLEDQGMIVKRTGTGLGLAICKSLVEMMQGSIAVDSVYGEGSNFWFTVTMGVDKEAATKAAEVDAETLIAPALNGKKILVVEDVETNMFVITSILTLLGCTFDLAVNGEEAVQRVKENKYDAVLMDCMMPVMDGYTATRLIREAGYKDLVIIALTANAMYGDREKGIMAGMNDYLSKPVAKNEVAAMLAKWLLSGEKIRLETMVEAVSVFQEYGEKFIELTLRDADKCVADIEQAVRDGNAEDMALSAHSLKSVMRQAGAHDTADIAFVLEKKGKASDMSGAEEMLEKLLKVYGETKAFLSEIAKKSSKNAAE